MTDERDKAFRRAQREALRERTALLAKTRDELIVLLKQARDQIKVTLAGTPSDYHSWYLPQLQAEIQRALSDLGERMGGVMGAAADRAWEAGAESVMRPLEAGGIRLAGQIPNIDTQQLIAMRTFMVDRIRDIPRVSASSINAELGLIMIGAQTTGDAISKISDILGDPSRVRATTIVRTELGRAYAVAAHEKMLQAAEKVPGLRKQWRRSGKIHSRHNHDAIDGQIQDVSKPFLLHSKAGAPIRMKHPHDPAAPASETINCGCVALAHMASWNMASPGKRPFTDEELRLNPSKADVAGAKTIAQLTGGKTVTSAAAKRTLKAEASRIASSPVEHAVFVDAMGNIVLSKTGAEKSVRFSQGELAAIRETASVHNHPGVGSFSDSDVAFAAANGLTELRVVDDAYLYSMSPPAGGWNAKRWEDEIKPLYDDAVNVLLGEFWDKLSAGTIPEDELRENFQHDVWQRVNGQLDLRYRRKARTDK